MRCAFRPDTSEDSEPDDSFPIMRLSPGSIDGTVTITSVAVRSRVVTGPQRTDPVRPEAEASAGDRGGG
jgi:hypothetical protein